MYYNCIYPLQQTEIIYNLHTNFAIYYLHYAYLLLSRATHSPAENYLTKL